MTEEIKTLIKERGEDKCKKCKRRFESEADKCECQPWLCYRCCECDTDCELCNCKHKMKK